MISSSALISQMAYRSNVFVKPFQDASAFGRQEWLKRATFRQRQVLPGSAEGDMLFPRKVRTSLLLYCSGGSDSARNASRCVGDSVGSTDSMSASEIDSSLIVRVMVYGSARMRVPDGISLEANAPRPLSAEGRTSYQGDSSSDIAKHSIR